MRKLVVLVVLTLMVCAVNEVFAATNDVSWSRTSSEEAITYFTIDRGEVIIEGRVQAARDLKESSSVGTGQIDVVSLEAKLLVCTTEDCRTVLRASSKEDITTTGQLRFDSNSVDVEAPIVVTIEVVDYNDTDSDGDSTESVGIYETVLSLDLNWQKGKEATSSVSCSLDPEGYALMVNEKSHYRAVANGIINGLSFSRTSRGSIDRNESNTVYGEQETGGCAA